MEQCFSSIVALAARYIAYFTVCLLAVSHAQCVQAMQLAADRDYILPAESHGGFISSPPKTQSARETSRIGSTVNYRAFDGSSHDLDAYAGRYITLLLPQASESRPFTADHIGEMVDRLDILYATYQELMQGEPRGSGPLLIAFVPQTCGLACGYIGSKGIEIQQDSNNYQRISKNLANGYLDSILTHEMAHNFDLYWEYLHYLPDHGHAWTDMFEYFAPFRFAREGINQQLPDDMYQSPSSSVWRAWLEDDSANWERCVRDQLCHANGFSENKLWAMLYYRIEALHGTDALLQSFSWLKNYAQSNLPPKTMQEKEDLRLMSLAVGAKTNISCYLDALKWSVSPTLRNELQARFGAGGQLCADNDLDGYSTLTGDCDDHDVSRNPGRFDIQGNGIDDDCDDVQDEYLLSESATTDLAGFSDTLAEMQLPIEIDASLSDLDDRDAVRFTLPPNGRVQVRLCAAQGFSGWVTGLQTNGEFLDSDFWYEPLDVAGCSRKAFDFSSQASGQLEVLANKGPGPYSLTVSAAEAVPEDYSPLLRVVPQSGGGMNLVIEDPQGKLAHTGANEMEIWISGEGLRLTVPYATHIAIPLNAASAPELIYGMRYQARLRPLKAGRPLEGFSAGHLFRFDLSLNTPSVLHDGFSGAWYDPSHDGEGFVVEINGNNRALVYWFTYTRTGAQRWMLGLGELHGNSLTVGELLTPEGGRFGESFDTADVTFARSGSLEISFLDCNSAIVNYSVDNIGDHQELQRLNSAWGHDCAGSTQASGIDLNGSWYDPAHSGEGFVVQQLSDAEALVYWFSYNTMGQQAWMFNTGFLELGKLTISNLVLPVGGMFGRSFEPDLVKMQDWGHLEIQLDCSGGIAVYDSNLPEFSSGSQKLMPLTRLANSVCNP